MNQAPQKMGPSEALVEILAANGVKHVFGIVGSAFMDALDIFPAAGIEFVPVAHEQGAIHMADGYARASGRHGVCIAQNGPGVTNFVTGVAAAYWAHSPVVFITPETGSMSLGLGGFQETEQLPIFSKITKYQGHVNNPKRMAEIAARCFDRAMLEMGPTQLNIPRDFFYGEIDAMIPAPMRIAHGPGDSAALDAAADTLAAARFPVILAGGGVIMSGGTAEAIALAEQLGAPVCNSYLHNDSFPASHALAVGPLGYQGSKAAMKLIAQADVVLALGTRLGPFGTLPQHGLDYWPQAGEDHPDRRRPAHAGTRQADLDRHSWRCARRSRSADRAPEGSHACRRRQSGRAQRADQGGETSLGKRADGLDARARPLFGRGRRQLQVHASARGAAGAREGDAGERDGIDRHRQHLLRIANSYLRFDAPRSMFAAMSFGNCGYAFPVICGAKMASTRPARIRLRRRRRLGHQLQRDC